MKLEQERKKTTKVGLRSSILFLLRSNFHYSFCFIYVRYSYMNHASCQRYSTFLESLEFSKQVIVPLTAKADAMLHVSQKGKLVKAKMKIILTPNWMESRGQLDLRKPAYSYESSVLFLDSLHNPLLIQVPGNKISQFTKSSNQTQVFLLTVSTACL